MTVWPAPLIVLGEADFTTVRAGPCATVTVAVEAGEVTAVPPGVVPATVAELVMEPASMSAWPAV